MLDNLSPGLRLTDAAGFEALWALLPGCSGHFFTARGLTGASEGGLLKTAIHGAKSIKPLAHKAPGSLEGLSFVPGCGVW